MHEVSFGLNWAVGMGGGDTLPFLAMSEVLPPHLTHFWSTIKNQHFLPGGLLDFTSLFFLPTLLKESRADSQKLCFLLGFGF